MNEQINSTAPRQTDGRGTSNEQAYAADGLRQRVGAQQGGAQTCKCGLDTGTRGWRYVYQTH